MSKPSSYSGEQSTMLLKLQHSSLIWYCPYIFGKRCAFCAERFVWSSIVWMFHRLPSAWFHCLTKWNGPANYVFALEIPALRRTKMKTYLSWWCLNWTMGVEIQFMYILQSGQLAGVIDEAVNLLHITPHVTRSKCKIQSVALFEWHFRWRHSFDHAQGRYLLLYYHRVSVPWKAFQFPLNKWQLLSPNFI